jgi:two-component system, OmpR family, alkaline phosphatase synthesis response regulator PhoP
MIADTAMPASRVTVLVIEDESIVADIYRLALERAGFDVVVARDGVDGLDKASTSSPSFIFLDIRMPGLDGIEVLRALAARGDMGEVPVVMLSNFDDPALVRESKDLGAKQYLIKAGMNPAELPGIVARWLGPSSNR